MKPLPNAQIVSPIRTIVAPKHKNRRGEQAPATSLEKRIAGQTVFLDPHSRLFLGVGIVALLEPGRPTLFSCFADGALRLANRLGWIFHVWMTIG
jgi:hypothetical protein